MFNRLNKFQAALALALYSQSALGQYYSNSTSISSNSSSTSVVSSSSGSVSISSSIAETSSSATDILSSITELASSSTGVSSTIAPSTSSSEVSSSVSQACSSSFLLLHQAHQSPAYILPQNQAHPSQVHLLPLHQAHLLPQNQAHPPLVQLPPQAHPPPVQLPSQNQAHPPLVHLSLPAHPPPLNQAHQSPGSTSVTESGSSASGSSSATESGSSSSASESSITQSGTASGSSASSTSGSVTQSGSSVSGSSASSAPGISSSIPQSTSSASTASGSITSGTLSSITSSASSATATASNSLSSSDGTIYLPSTTISGDITLTGSVIATEAVEVAAGGKLTLLDGDKYVFSADFIIHGGVFVEKSKPTYPGTEFDISGENFDVSGTFNAEEPAASSASAYSFTPGSFDNSGDISLSLSESTKGQVTFSPYSNSGAFSFSNAILNGGSVSGLQRRAESGSVNNGEINLENGSTYVVVEPVSGSGTINIISGNLYLHYPDTFTGQTVVFKGEGVLAVDPTESNTTPIPVVGYTGENQIAITADVTALSYDSATGVLLLPSAATPHPHLPHQGFTNSTSRSPLHLVLRATGSTASTSSLVSVAGHVSFADWFNGFPPLTSGSPSVYTTTLTYGTTTSTVVVSCSETTDSNGNVYTITTTVPCSSTTATITSCDETGCHVTAPTGTVATETVSSKSYTTVTVTHCTTMAVTPRLSLLNVPKKHQQLLLLQNHTLLLPLLTVTTTAVTLRLSPLRPLKPQPLLFLQKSYTTVTVTHRDDNGCNTKTVTSEAPEATTTTVSPKRTRLLLLLSAIKMVVTLKQSALKLLNKLQKSVLLQNVYYRYCYSV
nr:BFH_HP1_G0025460.mRNA.1.CDS.1 [Saccharomyces cerevisiae]